MCMQIWRRTSTGCNPGNCVRSKMIYKLTFSLYNDVNFIKKEEEEVEEEKIQKLSYKIENEQMQRFL